MKRDAIEGLVLAVLLAVLVVAFVAAIGMVAVDAVAELFTGIEDANADKRTPRVAAAAPSWPRVVAGKD